MNSNILIKLSDDDFRVEAFAEYLQRAQDRFGKLMQIVSDVSTYVEDRDSVIPLTEVEIADIREHMLSDYGMTNCVVTLDSGYTTLNELLDSIIKNCDSDINQIIYDNDAEPQTSFSDLGLLNHGVCNDVASKLFINLAELSDQLQSTLHSVTCLSAAVTAFAEKVKGNAVDVISRFNDIVSDTFANAHVDISSSVAFLKNKALCLNDPNEFLSNIMHFTGIQSESSAQSESTYTLTESDMYQYTGASPAGALDFSTAWSAATTIGKVAAGVVVGVVSGIVSMAKGLFSKICNKVSDIVIDPNDLEEINKEGFGTIDGLRYTFSNGYVSIPLNSSFPVSSAILTQIWDHFVASKSNKWIAMKTRFAEYMIKFTQMSYSDLSITLLYEVAYKPRLINANVIATAFDAESITLETEYETVLDRISSLGKQLYDISGLSEKEAYNSALLGFYYESKFSEQGLFQMLNNPMTVTTLAPYQISDLPQQITNLDWVKLASGWNGTTFTGIVPYSNVSVEDVVENTVKAIFYSMIYEDAYPAEQAPFIPYSNNNTDFKPASYRVKTDEQNKSAFNTFFTTIVIITIVAAIAITSVVILKRIARARYFKFAQRQGELDNKMWNGQRLTKAEQRRYVRAKKRCDKSSIFSSSLQQVTTSSRAVNDGSMSSVVVQLIRGDAV